MMQQGEAGQEGITCQPTSLVLKSAQIFVGTAHSDLGLHA